MFAKLIKFAAAATLFSTSLLGASATAAPWTFTTTGTISYGYDYSGVFSQAQDLAGLDYVLSTVVDTEAYQYKYANSQLGYKYEQAYGTNSAPITQKVTIGSVTKSYDVNVNANNWSTSSLYSSTFYTEAYQDFNGKLQTGEQIWGAHYVTSGHAFLDSVSLSQNLSYQPTAQDYGYAYFNMVNVFGSSSVYFSSNKPTSLTISQYVAPAAPVDVPEPAPLALFGLGLIALAVARSKKA